MLPFTPIKLHEVKYRVPLLISDIVRKREFSLLHSPTTKIFIDYIGDQVKAYTPDDFKDFHKTTEAIHWLSTRNQLFVRFKDTNYLLQDLVYPMDYEQGKIGELQNTLIGIAIAMRLQGLPLRREQFMKFIAPLSMTTKQSTNVMTTNRNVLNITIRCSDTTIHALKNPFILGGLEYEMQMAKVWTTNLDLTKIDLPRSDKKIPWYLQSEDYQPNLDNIQLVIGNNRGQSKYDYRIYHQRGSNTKEVRI